MSCSCNADFSSNDMPCHAPPACAHNSFPRVTLEQGAEQGRDDKVQHSVMAVFAGHMHMRAGEASVVCPTAMQKSRALLALYGCLVYLKRTRSCI